MGRSVSDRDGHSRRPREPGRRRRRRHSGSRPLHGTRRHRRSDDRPEDLRENRYLRRRLRIYRLRSLGVIHSPRRLRWRVEEPLFEHFLAQR